MKSSTKKKEVESLKNKRCIGDILECLGILILVDICCLKVYWLRWLYPMVLYIVQKAYKDDSKTYDFVFALEVVLSKVGIVIGSIAIQELSGGAFLDINGIYFLLISIGIMVVYLIMLCKMHLVVRVIIALAIAFMVTVPAMYMYGIWLNGDYTYGDNPVETIEKEFNIDLADDYWERLLTGYDGLSHIEASGYDTVKDKEILVRGKWHPEESAGYKLSFEISYDMENFQDLKIYNTYNMEVLKEE